MDCVPEVSGSVLRLEASTSLITFIHELMVYFQKNLLTLLKSRQTILSVPVSGVVVSKQQTRKKK